VLEGGDDCAVEMAAGIQNEVNAQEIVDCMRDLRDQKLNDEYVSLYHESNRFMKSLFITDIGLLGDFSRCLVKYYAELSKYLSTGKSSYKINAADVSSLRKLCRKLSTAAEESNYAYSNKSRIVTELKELESYLSGCEGKTLQEAIEQSKFAAATNNATTGVYGTLGYIFGGDYMDEIKQPKTKTEIGDKNFVTRGFPKKYVKSTLYDRDHAKYDWPKKKVISIMNKSPEVINHLGHANVDYLMKCNVKNMKNLKNSQAFFLYSQGCYAGSYDYMLDDDTYGNACIAETMIKTSGKSGAVACIVNSRYGWYSRFGTDGPSQLYHRKFWDRIFKAKPKSRQIGIAMAKSKHYFIEYLNGYEESSVMRFCYYTENLLGDPQTKLYDRCKAVKVPAKKVSINVGKSITIVKGRSMQLKATANPINTTDKLTWKSSNKKVVSVSSKGVIKTKKSGKATITVKTQSGKKAKVVVNVPKKVKAYKTTSVKLNKKDVEVDRGKKITIKATIKGSSMGKKWYSSNPRVATVNQSGQVKAKTAGKCRIYCRTAYGKKASCKITVTLPDLN